MPEGIPNVNLGVNPNINAYAYNQGQNNLINDDFLASQYFNQNPAVTQPGVPAFQGYAQPQADTFQKQSSSPLPSAILGGAVGTGAGYYLLSGALDKDGNLKEKMLNSIDNISRTETEKVIKADLFNKAQTDIINKTFADLNIKQNNKTLTAISEYVLNDCKLSGLSKELKAALPKEFKNNPKEAKAFIELLTSELNRIDTKKITEEAQKIVNSQSYNSQKAILNRMNSVKSGLENVKDTDLEKFIKQNREAFNISGADDVVEKAAKELAAKGKTAVLADLNTSIGAKDTLVKKLTANLNANTSYFEKGGKKLLEEAPETVTKAFKNFRWKTAGKFGLILAGVGLAWGVLSGGTKKA